MPPLIIDQNGRPISSLSTFRTAHDAAGYGRELASWMPGRFSADGEWLGEMEKARDRLDDLIRNNGIASGAVQKHVDNIIGAQLLLNYRPDRIALGIKPGTRDDQMDEFENVVEAKWDSFAEDIGCYIDASRLCRMSGLVTQGYRSYLSTFEITATGEWIKNRKGTKYKTAIQMIDPRRLCNKDGVPDGKYLRGGIVRGEMGEPVAYQFVSHLLGDPQGLDAGSFRTWKQVPKETPWGRQQVIHIYDVDKPGRSRGKGPVLSIMKAHKMQEKFGEVSLEAAVFNAMYAAWIQSSLDFESVSQAMGAGEDVAPWMLGQANAFHKNSNIRFNGLKIPHLFPGEEIKHLAPNHPAPTFEMFERAALRKLAAGWNLTYGQISNDYSQSNYSSERAALLEVWRFFAGRQYHIAGLFSTMVFALWFEEAIDNGEIVLPAGLPDFYDAKSAWLRSKWIGPGRGHIDILKEANGKKVRYSMGLETMESLASEDGHRWRDLIEQRAQEERYMRKHGIDPAQFNGPTPVPQPPDVQQVDGDGNPVGEPEGGDGGAPAPAPAKKPAPKPAGGGGAGGTEASMPQITMPALTINIPGQAPIQVDMTPVAEAIRVAAETRAVRELEEEERQEEIAGGIVVLGENLAGHGVKLEALRSDLNRPTVLVKDKSGRTIGARRVDKLPEGAK